MSISLNVDTSSWKKQFKSSLQKTEQAVDNTIKTVSNRLLNKIIEYTPVGNPNLWHPPYWPKNYTPGQLKASWVLEQVGKYEIAIKNEQPYALRIEYGWSSQAPEGMMRRASEEYPILVGRVAAEYKV